MNEQGQQDSAVFRDKDVYQHRRTWRNGRSKRHKVPCQQCGGLMHERGKHLAPGVVRLKLAKREREQQRAAAGAAVFSPGKDVIGTRWE